MIALRETAVRLAAAGVGISFLLSLAGKTPGKEILRFAAACVTVILLAGALRGVSWQTPALTLREAALAQELEQAQQETLRLQREETERALAAYLKERAAAQTLFCDASVICEIADNRLAVKSVVLTVKDEQAEGLSEYVAAISAELGISADAVSVREELP
ncbi:MAG: hypothetical protein IK141_06190 [Clostridia bacterium]|nr:hypothetical protein [Clostridia bacterium]